MTASLLDLLSKGFHLPQASSGSVRASRDCPPVSAVWPSFVEAQQEICF